MALFIIDSIEKLKQKMDLVSSLIDIKIALKLKKNTRANSKGQTMKTIEKSNPIDDQYANLKCKIKSMEDTRDDFKMIDKYIQNTSGDRLKVIDMFEIEREGEKKIFNPLGLGNKKLLFHGSRFSNFPGILA